MFFFLNFRENTGNFFLQKFLTSFQVSILFYLNIVLFNWQLAIKSDTQSFILSLEPLFYHQSPAFEQLFLSSFFICLACAPVLFIKMSVVGLCYDHGRTHGRIYKNQRRTSWEESLKIREKLEAVVQRCSVRKVFLENSQENTCTRASFLIKLQD